MKSRLALAFRLAGLALVAGLLAVVPLSGSALAGPASTRPAQTTGPGPSPAAPHIGTPINAACYVAAPGQCRLHVDPFNVNADPNTYLRLIRLEASIPPSPAQIIYEYGTDVNTLPATGVYYSPSPTREDFPALCGMTYQVNLRVQDNVNDEFANAGQTRLFTCPESNAGTQFLPNLFGPVGIAGLPLAGAVIAVAYARRSRNSARL